MDELRRDYMVTMLNFYKIPKDGESYRMRQSLSIDRMIWLMENEDALERFKEIDWDNIDISNIDWEGMGFYKNPDFQGATLQAAAKKYLMECGVTADECDALKSILTGNRS